MTFLSHQEDLDEDNDRFENLITHGRQPWQYLVFEIVPKMALGVRVWSATVLSGVMFQRNLNVWA